MPTLSGHLSHATAPPCASGDLDLWNVRCLVVLASERHYVRAAARLHLSQSGLSRAITALERRVGMPLIVRGARPLELTAQGEILVHCGRRLLIHQQAALDEIFDSWHNPMPGSRAAGGWL